MLSESTMEALTERLTSRIEQANIYTMKIIGNRIKEIGTLLPSDILRLNHLYESGNDINKIIRELARVTELNVSEIQEIFKEIAKKEYRLAKPFYDYRNRPYILFEQNLALQQQVQAIAQLTAEQYINLSRTTGINMLDINGNTVFMDIPKAYNQIVDEAIISIRSGTEGFQQRMQNTIKQLADSGVRTINYASGHTRRLDSAIRMNIMDGMREVSNEVQKIIGEEVGTDAKEISVHDHPAPDHATTQGHIFMNEEFDKMQSNQSYKDINGKQYEALDRVISQWNCYHYIYSVIAEISKPRYSQEELDRIIQDNNKGFEFEGKHRTLYEGSQLQRYIETEIRRQKETQILARASGNVEITDNTQVKISQLTTKYNELSNVSGLPTKIDRLRVNGFRKVKTDVKDYYDNTLIGLNINNTTISSVSNHFINDSRPGRGLKLEMIEDALKNPLDTGIIKIDRKGRKSFKVIGEMATISINPDTGIITTGWRTGTNILKKYGK